MIEFYFWRECPSHERALDMVKSAMAARGIDESELRVQEVVDDGGAQALNFPGSPTIRVNGRDVQDPGDNPVGLSCRLYIHRDGRPSPLPDAEDLTAAIDAAYPS